MIRGESRRNCIVVIDTQEAFILRVSNETVEIEAATYAHVKLGTANLFSVSV